ncbi:hypothetical protein TW95_gp1535 [Pandoravirus inopinatum]|uniref:Uncharacterized protein n=1 Tax=Pandoravirus inopinatum TaxID=1605721 RepID=A0A0B5J3U7_9VIRU|nr:hypothetical protein TW95_gp1535 [Pandoravirus inopinatum]AJF98269.1 hypothetical protein [Pandoravirus inopinatum]
MECQAPVDDAVPCAPPETDRMQVERTVSIGVGQPAAFVVLKIALFLIAVILLGGAVVFAYKVVGMLVDAGTRAVDRTLAARNFMPLLSTTDDVEPQPPVCAAPQAGGTYYLQQWRSVFVDPHTVDDDTRHF